MERETVSEEALNLATGHQFLQGLDPISGVG